jgi:glucose-6-phosphate isomerase
MIKFDMSRVLKENVSGGIEKKEIEGKAKEALEVVENIKKNEPGFLRIINNPEVLGQIKELQDWLFNFEDFVVLGIGGSALGNIALHKGLRPLNWNDMSFEERGGYLRVHVTDNVDPDFVASILDAVDLNATVFNVISKSGSTAEAMANYLVARNIIESFGLDPREHFVFTTDPEKGVLRKIAKKEGIRVLDVPPDVGGRFSVLTQVGLLSAMAEGIDIDELHRGAEDAKKRCFEKNLWNNPAVLIATIHYLFYEKGRKVTVMMPYSNRLYYLADWFRQLWAESLGKNGKGQTPVKALGTTDQHSQIQLYNEGPNDKLITFIKVEKYDRDILIGKLHGDEESLSYLGGRRLSELINSELEGTEAALTERGKPSMKLVFDEINEYNFGYFFVTYECATVIAGGLFGVNPYDQPGVELGKRITYALMGRKGYEKEAEIGKIKKEYVI